MKNNTSIKSKFLLQISLIAMAIFGLAACYNQNSNAQSNQARFYAMERTKDQQFLMDAADMSMEQIKMGQLAQKKSINIDIQEFGVALEGGHTKLLNDLMPLAKSKSVSIPSALTDKSQQAYNQLNMNAINYFNKAYCDIAVSRHQDAITKFQKESTESADDDIKRWAVSKLPELRRLLDLAVATQKKFEPMK
jgi:putative membrane protein